MLPRLLVGRQRRLARQAAVSVRAPMTHSTLKQRRGGLSPGAAPPATKAKVKVSTPKERPPRGNCDHRLYLTPLSDLRLVGGQDE